MAIIDALSDIVTVGHFVKTAVEIIADKISARGDRLVRNPREDRKVYEKYEVTVGMEGDTDSIIIVHIHIYN